MSIPEWVLAYTAGLVDGEGSIHVVVVRGEATAELNGHEIALPRQISLRISVLMTDRAPLDFLSAWFGKSVTVYRRQNSQYRDVYQWRMAGGDAQNFIRLIQPYLLVKAAQAKLALQFPAQSIKTLRLSERQNVIDIREGLRNQISALNHGREAG